MLFTIFHIFVLFLLWTVWLLTHYGNKQELKCTGLLMSCALSVFDSSLYTLPYNKNAN